MVMKKNVMGKNLRQSILRSITRYIAIVAIIALGAGIFVGLRSTKKDMIVTGQIFMEETNMFDLRLLSTYGWNDENVASIAAIDGVVDAEGVITLDVLGHPDRSTEDAVYKLYAIPDSVNKVNLLGGRMPQSPDECLVDGAHVNDSVLGTTFVVSKRNQVGTLDSLKHHTFTVVGYISTPLYMDMSRGTTTLGNGSVASYVYIPRDAFDVDYYTEIGITIDGEYQIYSDDFTAAMDDMAAYIEPLLSPIAQTRYESVKQDALDAYEEGLEQYYDGLQKYLDGKQDAQKELADAYRQLLDGQAEIDSNFMLLQDGLKQIESGQKTIYSTRQTLYASRKQLANAKVDAYAQLAEAHDQLVETRKTVNENLLLVKDGLVQIEDGLNQLDSGISQLESGLQQLDLTIKLMDTTMKIMDANVEAARKAIDRAVESGIVAETIIERMRSDLQKLLDKQAEQEAQYQALLDNRATYGKQLEDLKLQRQQVVDQQAELLDNQAMLQQALVDIENGFQEIEDSKPKIEYEFAAAQAQIESGFAQLDAAQAELNQRKAEAEDGLRQLQDAQVELEKGFVEFQKGLRLAEHELAKGRLQLLGGKVELDEGKRTIDSFEQPKVYALTRNTNVSYLSLESNAGIVEGVSAVFPAFFLLIAALVCITTMTRMVEEERTQIGTLKALGYGNWAIIGKYLAYAGSAAVIGCGLGVVVGSVVFPIILWEAYNIILNITPHIELRVDWALCTVVVTTYTAVTLLVTWYCCRMTLREVSAELIRPKPPTTGKKIFLEYLPFWNKISFLNKVMLRNIFRYRQRLLMMMIGIGGCTALLLTGFGIRDSICEIVDFQFKDVTLYDMEIRFEEAMDRDDQDAFVQEIGRYVDDVVFAHQSSVELDFDSATRDIIMICADNKLTKFMDFHHNGQMISMPGRGEALLSVGIADKLGINVGDRVLIRNPDMQTISLKISGIYDNYVYNYILLTPQTIIDAWDEAPQQQMAYITVKDTQDVHISATKVSGYDGVMNVSICEDLADQVGSMLDAMNLVVITVVICAGMLAVTVLYNLTNINITERLREIATIKVLGFNARESAAYVFKENLLLSAMGSAVGLPAGYGLLLFVMSQIKVDMVWLPARLMSASYVWSVALTMLCACLVDLVLYFKLEKINMAEALKSVE